MKLFLEKLLKVETSDRSKWQIILWWEYRRILYNAIVLVAGLLSLLIMASLVQVEKEIEGGMDGGPFVIIIFAMLCNVCYTLGWFTEIFIPKNDTYGSKMFKIGLGFTLFWIFIPILIIVIISVFS